MQYSKLRPSSSFRNALHKGHLAGRHNSGAKKYTILYILTMMDRRTIHKKKYLIKLWINEIMCFGHTFVEDVACLYNLPPE
jgi:hypothetical protein